MASFVEGKVLLEGFAVMIDLAIGSIFPMVLILVMITGVGKIIYNIIHDIGIDYGDILKICGVIISIVLTIRTIYNAIILMVLITQWHF